MSAYVVDRAHIEFLVLASVHPSMASIGGRGLAWWWEYDPTSGEPIRRGSIEPYDDDRAAEVAQMLWDENVASVAYRYPDSAGGGPGCLPGPVDCSYEFGAWTASLGPAKIEPAAVFKAVDGYTYLSCEHPGWPASEAFAFCEALRRRACCQVPGYDAAEWTITKPAPSGGGVFVSDLARQVGK